MGTSKFGEIDGVQTRDAGRSGMSTVLRENFRTVVQTKSLLLRFKVGAALG